MDLNAILRIAVELGASDIHLKLDQPPMLRTDGSIAPLPGCPELGEQDLLARARDGDADRAGPDAPVPRQRRPRHRLHGRGPAALPRQRLPPARRDLICVPRHPQGRAELRAAEHASRRRPARERAPRPRPRHRRDRLGEDDDACVDARPHQPDAEPAHRHDRGPDRDPPSGPELDRQPARGRPRHRELRAGAPPGAPPGPGRDPDRRAPRRRDRADGSAGRRVRATSSSRRCTPSTPPRPSAG